MYTLGFAGPEAQATPHRPMAMAMPFNGGVRLSRHSTVGLAVVVFHLLLLWLVQSGLLHQAVQKMVPTKVTVVLAEPEVLPPPPAPIKPPVVPQPRMTHDQPVPSEAPPVPVAQLTPDTPPTAVVVSTPLAAPPPAAPIAPPAPPRVELPSSDADYLQNPKPRYPAVSKKMGEQGRVLVRVLIGADGSAQKAEIKQSSGFERLDQAALSTVLLWHYVPGKRGGVPEAMWFNVPITFELG